MAEITITSENFASEVEQSQLPVLIDFWAAWCGPCKMMAPVVAQVAEELDGKVKVGKCDVDENGELAQRFGVMSIPTFILFRNGKQEKVSVGGQSKEKLLSFATE